MWWEFESYLTRVSLEEDGPKIEKLNLIQDGGQTETLKNKTKKIVSILDTGNTWPKFQDCSFKSLDVIALTKYPGIIRRRRIIIRNRTITIGVQS